ncbi:MAG: DUF4417 domain-containing protein [Lachnospiraceae bacterium]|nr:DUF4417 domain-containing protein [Lachnospiraceae bacterium]
MTNRTVAYGKMDLPAINCTVPVFPDFIALYSETSLYHKTERTAISFFQYDKDFDGKNGLFWAIYYDVKERLAYFKERFKNVKYVITPDFSELGDIHKIENDYRLFKGRIVGLWFLFEIGAVVIPNITFPTAESADFALNGYEGCSVVAISTKGHMDNPDKNQRLRTMIRLTIEKLPKLKTFIVYDVCASNDATLDTFSCAIEKGIEVLIPDNTLKNRNSVLCQERHDSRKAVRS